MNKDKMNFVKQQHYIPQFALKNFQKDDNKISYTIIKQSPLKVHKSGPMKIMQEKDFYEIKDDNGNYVLRNTIEDSYSGLESIIKPNFQEFINLSRRDDFQDKFVEIIQNERWTDIETSLLLYLIITLIRGKGVKNLVYLNPKLKDSEKHIMYLLLQLVKLMPLTSLRKCTLVRN